MTLFSGPDRPETSSPAQELQQTIAKLLDQADDHYQAGEFNAAEELYHALLAILPDHPEANFRLGRLLAAGEDPASGLPYFRTAVSSSPQCSEYWQVYIDTLIETGQMDGARQALALAVRHGLQSEAAGEFARRISVQGQNMGPSASVQQADTLDSPPPQAGMAPGQSEPLQAESQRPTRQEIKKLASLRQKGRLPAIETFARELTIRYPNHGEGWRTLGSVLAQRGLAQEALPIMRKAVQLSPETPGLLNDFGLLLSTAGLLDEAERHFTRALEIDPDFTPVLSNLGNQYRAQGRLGQAEAHLRHALQLESNAILYNNLGATLLEAGRILEAENCFHDALKLAPAFSLARVNLGICLRKQGRLKEAIDHQEKAVKGEPLNTELRSNLLFTKNYATGSAEHLLHEARQFGQLVTKLAARPFSTWICSADPQRLRVGVVSGDLYNHPVGFFLESVLQHIDGERIELIAYPTNPKADDLTARIKACCSEWKPLYGTSDEAAAQLIHSDGIHFLLDLSGHTSHNRLPLFAWKPAPVQASWLGYFATTGVAEMDFFLADEVGVPEAQRGNFTEAIWYLPETRLCFSEPRVDLAVAPLPAIGNGFVTFGCFQLLTKVGDEVLGLWSRILQALPEARLRWQCSQFSDAAVVDQVKARLRRAGIAPERVTMLGSTSRASYLAAHGEVDLLLDTFPFPGGTTTCEALWMGVPTVTLAGESLLSRQGASILSAAGLGNWVANTEREYVDLAIGMACDLARLAGLRDSLRAKVIASPVFNAQRFARNLEEALWAMWQERKPKTNLSAPKRQEAAAPQPADQEKPVMNFFNPVFWGTKDPELFTRLMKQAAELTNAYHFGDNMFLFQRNNSMLNDQPFMQSWSQNALTPPDRTIIWRRYILAMAGFHCQHLEGDFVECGAYQGVGAKTVLDYLGGKDFPKTFWLYDLFEHKENSVNHPMQAHGPQLHAQVVQRFKDYPNVKIFKGFLPEVLALGSPEKIAYLHLDLNQAPAEIATLEVLFDRVVPGGIIILDDYEMVFYRAQKLAEDIWFGRKGYKVFPLPTSQGFIIKR